LPAASDYVWTFTTAGVPALAGNITGGLGSAAP
jgi:hypothetical protein